MNTHARLSPSSRYRWSRCAASVNACTKYEVEGRKSSPAAIDGTHSHTLLEHCLKHKGGIVDPKTFMGTVLSDHEGMFGVDMDRCERVQIAVDYIRVAEQVGATIISEKRVNPFSLVGRDDMSGTVDVQVHWPDGTVEIIDYKDGMNPVVAKDNEQIEQYAVGVLAEALDHGVAFDTVRMTIIQPKAALKGREPISSHDVSTLDMLGRIPKMVEEATATDNPDAPYTPGEKQCSYCPNRGNCSAHNEHFLKSAGIKFDKVEFAKQAAVESNDMTDEQLREIIEAAPMLRQLIEAAEGEALRRIESGKPVAGLKAVRGPGRRSWAQDEPETAEKLSKMGVPKAEVWRTVLVSPAQAEKLTWTKRDGTIKQLTQKQLAVLHRDLITKSDGKLTVVPESDRREAVTFDDLSKAFEPVPQNGDDVPEWLK